MRHPKPCFTGAGDRHADRTKAPGSRRAVAHTKRPWPSIASLGVSQTLSACLGNLNDGQQANGGCAYRKAADCSTVGAFGHTFLLPPVHAFGHQLQYQRMMFSLGSRARQHVAHCTTPAWGEQRNSQMFCRSPPHLTSLRCGIAI